MTSIWHQPYQSPQQPGLSSGASFSICLATAIMITSTSAAFVAPFTLLRHSSSFSRRPAACPNKFPFRPIVVKPPSYLPLVSCNSSPPPKPSPSPPETLTSPSSPSSSQSSSSSSSSSSEPSTKNSQNELSDPAFGLASTSAPLNPVVIFGEFISTFLLIFLSIKLSSSTASSVSSLFPNAALISSLAASFIPVCGAHFNPAVTIALLVTNRVAFSRSCFFILAQSFASIAASALILFLNLPLNPPLVPSSTPLLHAFALEFIPMFLIVSVVFLTAVATKREGGTGLQIAPVYIGLAVLTSAAAFPTSTFNPARAFGPALLAGQMNRHWILWVAPILGAISAALMCEHLFLSKAVNRPPNSWLAWVSEKCSSLTNQVRTLGVAGLISYGILNTLYYTCTFSIMMIRIGWSAGAAGLAQAWFVTWSLSQVTKPLRLAISIAIAPLVNRWLVTFKKRKQQQ